MSSSTIILAAVLFLGLMVIQARSVSYGHGRSLLQVTSALVGYQQGVYLAIGGTDPASECSVSGIPGPDGYSAAGPSPVLFTTPKGTGVHIIATTLPAGWNSIVALISSPQSNAYSVDNTDPLNPTLVFDASKASEGESGIAGIAVYDAAGAYICKSTVSFQVTAPLGCLPTSTGPVVPQPTGNTVYVDNSVSTTIVQSITQIITNYVVTNVQNINQVTCICCYQSCNGNVLYEIVNNVTINNKTVSPPNPRPNYPTAAPPPRVVVPLVYPPSSGTSPPRTSPAIPASTSPPPPRSAPPPVTGGSSTTPPPRASPTSPPPASLQAPPPGSGNRTTFNILTPPAGRK